MDEYESLLEYRKIGHTIYKNRYSINIPSNVIEIDVYVGRLSGLLIAEVEFDNYKYSVEYITEMVNYYLNVPISNVTHNKGYKNSNLCKLDKLDAL